MKAKLKAILHTAWNEPRHFFFWLMQLSLAGLVLGYVVDRANLLPYDPHPWVQTAANAVAACLVAGVVVGFFGFILSCIPPIRRLFARMLQSRFFVLACLVTLVALFYTEENLRGKWAWERYKQACEAKGEKMEPAAFIPLPVPANQNFALTPVVASSYAGLLDKDGHEIQPRDTNVVNRLKMAVTHDSDWPSNGIGNWQKSTVSDLKSWQQYYRALAAKTNEFPVPSQPQSSAADVLLALSRYDSAIDELRRASQLPYSRFPLSYGKENPVTILLPHLGALRECARMLQLRAIAELQNGQTDKALEDMRLALRLADSVRTEPILVSHLVRIAIVHTVLQPVWEGLAEQKWSGAQLAALDRELAGLDFLADYRLSMRGELVLFEGGIFDYLRHHPEQLPYLCGEPSSSPPASVRILCRLIPRGWIYQNQLRCARVMEQGYLPVADVDQRIISPAATRRADAAVEADTRHLNPYNVMERILLPALGKAARRFASGQSSVDLARVAIALERYRQAHGEHPESLDALVPQFIAKLPHDIITGQPLKYRRADGQFVLYSVGWNETDDGGRVVLKESGTVDPENGDWVWHASPHAEAGSSL